MRAQEAKNLFTYAGGNIFWKNPIRCMKRSALGSKNPKGYLRISVNGKYFFVHRIIWMIHNGDIPDHLQIDHINRNKADNRIENLRLVTIRENLENRERGLVGFHWDKQYQKWRSQARIGKKLVSVGRYSNQLDARAAYLAAKRGDWETAKILQS